MHTHIFRLHPNTPLRESLEEYCAAHTPLGAAMVTCVGSLRTTRLRMAGANDIIERTGPFEILSLVGTWTPEGGHWHISLSDGTGSVWGGIYVRIPLSIPPQRLSLLILDPTTRFDDMIQ